MLQTHVRPLAAFLHSAGSRVRVLELGAVVLAVIQRFGIGESFDEMPQALK